MVSSKFIRLKNAYMNLICQIVGPVGRRIVHTDVPAFLFGLPFHCAPQSTISRCSHAKHSFLELHNYEFSIRLSHIDRREPIIRHGRVQLVLLRFDGLDIDSMRQVTF